MQKREAGMVTDSAMTCSPQAGKESRLNCNNNCYSWSSLEQCPGSAGEFRGYSGYIRCFMPSRALQAMHKACMAPSLGEGWLCSGSDSWLASGIVVDQSPQVHSTILKHVNRPFPYETQLPYAKEILHTNQYKPVCFRLQENLFWCLHELAGMFRKLACLVGSNHFCSTAQPCGTNQEMTPPANRSNKGTRALLQETDEVEREDEGHDEMLGYAEIQRPSPQ